LNPSLGYCYLHHLTAFFRTFPARFRAMTAVSQLIVPFAFGSTAYTNGRAYLAKQRGIVATHGHQLCCGHASYGAFAIERDTQRESFDIILFETFCSAMLAFQRACNTGVYARLEISAVHCLRFIFVICIMVSRLK
jgi:hypothetical protein